MKNRILTLAAIITMSFGASAQITIEDVTLAPTFKAGDNSLSLNGGGLREKYFLDLYIGGLYVTTKTSDAQAIIDADEPMSIQLNIISDLITSEKMIASTEEGFEKSTDGKQEDLRKDIDLFMAAFKEEIKDGNVFDITYSPANGVEVFKNGTKTTTVGDLAFKKALFGIWLCNDPADKDLKKGMLGL
jgi:hypothetical protein